MTEIKEKKKRETDLGTYYCEKLSDSFPKVLLLPPVSLIKISHQGGEKNLKNVKSRRKRGAVRRQNIY